MTPLAFQRRLLQTIRSAGLVPRRARLVLAVSGGADSMALLDAMAALAVRRDTGWTLQVAHLDHRIRGRSAVADARFVKDQAALRGLPFHSDRVDVPALARRQHLSLEEAARRCRYEFLRTLAEKLGAAAVALAHHADDQVETILHHIVRGTGLRGLCGMPVARPILAGSSVQVVRPLLGMRRHDLHEYLVARDIPWRRDPSNIDPRHTRNRIRATLIPLLQRRFNPRVTDAILRLSVQARWAYAMIEQAAGQVFSPVPRPSRSLHQSEPSRLNAHEARIAFKSFHAAPPLVQTEIIRGLLTQLGVGASEIGYERLEAVMTALARPHGGKRVELPGGASVLRRGREVIVSLAHPTRGGG